MAIAPKIISWSLRLETTGKGKRKKSSVECTVYLELLGLQCRIRLTIRVTKVHWQVP